MASSCSNTTSHLANSYVSLKIPSKVMPMHLAWNKQKIYLNIQHCDQKQRQVTTCYRGHNVKLLFLIQHTFNKYAMQHFAFTAVKCIYTCAKCCIFLTCTTTFVFCYISMTFHVHLVCRLPHTQLAPESGQQVLVRQKEFEKIRLVSLILHILSYQHILRHIIGQKEEMKYHIAPIGAY